MKKKRKTEKEIEKPFSLSLEKKIKFMRPNIILMLLMITIIVYIMDTFILSGYIVYEDLLQRRK